MKELMRIVTLVDLLARAGNKKRETEKPKAVAQSALNPSCLSK
jgi:hypothetical protein